MTHNFDSSTLQLTLPIPVSPSLPTPILLHRSGVAADQTRLKETQHINKSLSCLADVFSALSKKSRHVPYRNSKLTHLLQSCLSKQGKTLMMVNVSPEHDYRNETLCSLRFATQVNQTELGRAEKHIYSNSSGSSRAGSGGLISAGPGGGGATGKSR